MEPDKERWLAHRILRVEREPVSWDKAHVWERIDEQLQPARFRGHSVAAAVSTILLLLSYFTIDVTDKSIQPPDVITGDHSATEMPFGPSEKLKEVPIQQKVTHAGREEKPKYASKENNNLRDTVNNAVAIETTDQPDDKADSTAMPHIVIAGTKTEVVGEEKIRPVIGVTYPDTPTLSMASHKRRKKLHKLEAGAAEPWTPPLSNTIILAGKK